MNLVVLVPSIAYKATAGARIRYGRIADHLRARGIALSLVDIAEFDPASDAYDVVLVSKCHDAGSLLAAAVASDRGRLVGVDLFDDYFSDKADGRLARYRNWLSQIVGLCDFAFCSTALMELVVNQYRSNLPTLRVNDPAPDHDVDVVAALIASKLARARELRSISVAWFGVGDNPYFPIGLRDLAAHGSALGELSRHDFQVELTILTNRRALSADGLSLIGKLPVRPQIIEWTELAERQVLDDVLLAFLPVNAQPFSAAKSLNRAITALAHGCQVLSVGYPLYAALDPLIYRRADEFVADLTRGTVRFSPEAIDDYRAKIDALASPEREAKSVAEFLTRLERNESRRASTLKLVHGQTTRAEIHRLVKAQSGLSVASPYCRAALDFDVVFRGGPNNLQMLMTPNASRRLSPWVKQRLKKVADNFLLFEFDEDAGQASNLEDWSNANASVELATYDRTMTQIRQRLEEVFGPGRTIISELSTLPFQVAPQRIEHA